MHFLQSFWLTISCEICVVESSTLEKVKSPLDVSRPRAREREGDSIFSNTTQRIHFVSIIQHTPCGITYKSARRSGERERKETEEGMYISVHSAPFSVFPLFILSMKPLIFLPSLSSRLTLEISPFYPTTNPPFPPFHSFPTNVLVLFNTWSPTPFTKPWRAPNRRPSSQEPLSPRGLPDRCSKRDTPLHSTP